MSQLLNRSCFVIFTALSLLGCNSVTYHQSEVKWSLSDDLAVYQRIYQESGKAEMSIFPAYLRSAAQFQRYRDAVEGRTHDLRCESWIVVQSIEIESSQYEFLFLCRTSDAAWSATNGWGNEANELKIYISPQYMDKLLARTYEIEGAYYRSVFDAHCVYVTSFNGKEIARFAVYAPVNGTSHEGVAYDSASALVNFLRLSVGSKGKEEAIPPL
ncbi:hypothetical protein [Xanthomonas arboricola]|uniref:hypothetical protein n=1 Tax=Xanthomonas arboricola TaxID=56448 RepID=UPI0012901401|nr:hypothetical protein [Xanthomonas arboricola]